MLRLQRHWGVGCISTSTEHDERNVEKARVEEK